MISNEILEEIIYISLKYKFIDQKMIKKAFVDLYKRLDDYTKNNFRRLVFAKIDERRASKAICSREKGLIVFDTNRCYQEEKEKNIESMLLSNLNIINSLIHEVEHLKEPAKLLNNNLESLLISCSTINDIKVYNEYYERIPNEKMAFANSWELLLNSLKKYPNFDKNFFEEYKHVNNEFVRHLKLGYFYDEYFEIYNIPVEEFLDGTNQIEVLTKLKEMLEIEYPNNDMDSKTKLKYGLYVTEEDLLEVNKMKILK